MKKFIIGAAIVMCAAFQQAQACTGIAFMANDNGYVMARTMEWSGDYVPYEYVVIPRNQVIVSYTPSGQNGMTFKSKYGVVGIAAAQKEFIIEGLNEVGLSAGLFYFPNYGEYVKYDPAKNKKNLADLQFVSWVLTQFSTIDEVKNALGSVNIISANVGNNSSTVHWRIGEASGKQVVLEFIDGKPVFYDNAIGVLTNAPDFNWQMTNLNNYINLKPGVSDNVKWENVELKSIGGCSNFLGLPGDMTPPSRFVRAAFYKSTAPRLASSYDAVMQSFHILNNFDIPIGSEHPSDEIPNVPSGTPCTSAIDLKEMKLYYHTNYNSNIRCIDLKKIDFSKVKYQSYPLDKSKIQPVEEIVIS